jgi:hypothetical protein
LLFFAYKKELLRLIDLCPFLASEKSTYDDAAVLNLLTYHPAAANKRHSYRCGIGTASKAFPLALVVALGGSIDVVTRMVNSCPMALNEKLSGRRNVLHYAIAEGVDISIIQYLTSCNPSLVKEVDSFHAIPLHLASTYYPTSSVDVVRHLLQLYPHGAGCLDNKSQTPLHRACRSRASLDKMQYLIEAYPNAIFKQDWVKSTPLEYAESMHQRLSEPCPNIVKVLGMVEELMKMGQSNNNNKCHVAQNLSCPWHENDDGRRILNNMLVADRAKQILTHFQAIHWHGGIRLAFKSNIQLISLLNLPKSLYPRLLSLLLGDGDGDGDDDNNKVEIVYSMLVHFPQVLSVGGRMHHT